MNFADNCSINIDNATNLIKPNVNVFPLLSELFGLSQTLREKRQERQKEREREITANLQGDVH